MADPRPLTLEDVHLKLYVHGLTIYCCPDDHPEQWFIMPNPAFYPAATYGAGGVLKPGEPYVFRILGRGVTPAEAFEDWERTQLS